MENGIERGVKCVVCGVHPTERPHTRRARLPVKNLHADLRPKSILARRPAKVLCLLTLFRSSEFLLPLEQAGFSDIVFVCVCASGA